MKFKIWEKTRKCIAICISESEYRKIKPMLKSIYSEDTINTINKAIKHAKGRFLLCNPALCNLLCTPVIACEYAEKYFDNIPYKDIEFEETTRTDLVTEFLNGLNFPYDDYCVNYIVKQWEDDHIEQLNVPKEDRIEIDKEDVELYWFSYVKENLFV